jgi:hypothetical protein
MRGRFVLMSIVLLAGSVIFLSWQIFPVNASGISQQPTVALPTVTSTPGGPVVTVISGEEQLVSVRSGPGVFYDKIGVLLAGQQLPAKGRSEGGDWILVEYPGVPGSEGWVYAPFVSLTPGHLPIVEPPPKPTPLYTATIDPTLAAQFISTAEPTRLPTYTQAAPLVIPTYTDASVGGITSKFPMGLIIIAVTAVGILLGLFSLAQRR